MTIGRAAGRRTPGACGRDQDGREHHGPGCGCDTTRALDYADRDRARAARSNRPPSRSLDSSFSEYLTEGEET